MSSQQPPSPPSPLQGVRVIDMSRVLAGVRASQSQEWILNRYLTSVANLRRSHIAHKYSEILGETRPALMLLENRSS